MKQILITSICGLAGILGSTAAAESFLSSNQKSQPETMKQQQPALSCREQCLVAISARAAAGDLPGLERELAAGLDAGLGVEEIKEALVQLYAYCGFPRSLNALGALMSVVRERAARGAQDAAGSHASPILPRPSVEVGAANQERLCGAPVTGELFAFAPAIDAFLKAHLFGDIFSRDNLDWKTRELVTVAALAALPDVEAQLTAHMGIARRNGWSRDSLDAAVAMGREAGRPGIFAQGKPATAHFAGKAWVAMLVEQPAGQGDLSVYNVTFAPGARNDWHRHSVGQILLCTSGAGFYQERGNAARKLRRGDVVAIPAETDHWHGAGPDGAFTHIGITPRVSENETKWGEPVSEADYAAAQGHPEP